MNYEFYIGSGTAERFALAAHVLGIGRVVKFDDFQLRLSSRRTLVISVLAEHPHVPDSAPLEHLRRSIEATVGSLLVEQPALAPLQSLHREFELIHDYGKGAVSLGFWSATGFQPGSLPE